MAAMEHVPAGEDEQIANVIRLTVEQLKRRYPPNNRILRGVHPKDHGCVSATFRVHDTLPPELQVGVFAALGREYEAVIRYSNASVLVAPDAIPAFTIPGTGSMSPADPMSP